MKRNIQKCRISAVVLLSIIMIVGIGGCKSECKINFTYIEQSSEIQGVSMNLDSIRLMEDRRIEAKVIWRNNSGRNDLVYGDFYELLRYENDDWKKCVRSVEPSFDSIAHLLHKQREQTYDLSLVTERMEKDTLYKLQSVVTDADGRSYNSTVTFRLKDTIHTGLYRVSGRRFHALFSSSSGDYFYNKNKEMRYIIEEDLFAADASKVESKEFVETISYPEPRYVTEEIGNQIVVFGDMTVDLTQYRSVKCQKVLDRDGNDTGYRIYYLDDEVCIGHFDWYGEKKDAWWCEYIFSIEQ